MKSILLLLFLFCFSNLIAQSKGTIFGNVKSSENMSLSGVKISLEINNQNKYFVSDTLGDFLSECNIGKVNMSIEHVGYLDKNLSFDLKKDTAISIVLIKDVSFLKEVLVVNNKKRAISDKSGGKLSLNIKEMSSIPSLLGTTDVIKILQLTPGVQNSGDANGYLYVRGGDPGHNSILYNGTTIYGMSHLLGIFPFYNADHIQEVEFDKSSSNSKYGGRLSSTALLIPNKNIPKDFGIQGNVGLLSSQTTLTIPVGKKSGFYISGRKTYIDEVLLPILNSGSKNSDVEEMKYGFSDGNLSFISQISKNSLLTVDGFVSGDKLEIDDSNLTLESTLKWNNFTISPNVTTVFSPHTSMSNALYYTNYSNELNMAQSSINIGVTSFVQDFGYNNSIRYLFRDIPIESGLQYVHHDVQPQKIQIKDLGTQNDLEQVDLIKANELAVFTTARPKLLDNLDAEFGLRFNYYSSGQKVNSFFNIEPRVLLNYYPNTKFSFYACYNRQNQYLNLITTSSVGIPTDFWIASDSGIKPQSSNEISLGSNQKISKRFTSSISGFYRSMSNLLEYPYGVTQFNEISNFKDDLLVGNGKAYGLETMVKKSNGKFNGWVSYTLSWSTRDFEELNNGNSFFAKYDRRHNLSIVGMYDLNSEWNFGITQIFSSGNHFTMPTSWYFINNNPVKEYSGYNNAQMPNYIRTDISVNYFFVKNSKKESALNFSIYNTFNVGNPIYVVLKVAVDGDKNTVRVTTDDKILYRILPSISWKFKF